MSKGRLKIPQDLINWLEKIVNENEYGEYGFVLTLHKGKMRYRKIYHESGEIHQLKADK